MTGTRFARLGASLSGLRKASRAIGQRESCSWSSLGGAGGRVALLAVYPR